GAGGMGEVYRARDMLLKRDVAIKVLPLAFAGDPERIARFQREAEVLATLNHPNIAAIHGLQDSDGVRSLVLEFVDGPTLADLIGGRPMPLDNVLAIARQIADALEAAHERGIIHRDLKPANVKVRPDGTVKVLDFGLAKALEGRSPPEGVNFGVSQSPTITSPAMTRVGVVLGTAAYMSPEQARGHDADQRSDLWAFGCVLFEMLTGRRAFEGDEVSDTLAAVLRAEPDVSALPNTTPASVRRLLRRCLEKNSKRRLADIRDARLELDESSAEPLAETPRAGRRSPWRERIAWSLAVVGLVVAIVAAARLWQRETPSVPTAQFAILPPNGTALAPVAETVAVAPDGQSVVFAAGGSDAPWQLWWRSMDGLNVRPLAGTEGARIPFWSGDSKSIGFYADGKLKRVEIGGGPARTLADVDSTIPLGGTWNSEGIILFTPSFGRPIVRISASGGASTAVTTLKKGESQVHNSPFFLPDGRHFLYSSATGPSTHVVYFASLDGGAPVRLVETNSYAQYAEPGYLLYMKDKALMAHPFDAQHGTLVGEPVSVATSMVLGGVVFSASTTRTLIYRSTSTTNELVWVDRQGHRTGVAAPVAAYESIALSPDGKRIAFDRYSSTDQDVWVYDIERQLSSRFTSQGPFNNVPVWAPDSGTIAFATGRNGGVDIYQRKVGVTGDDDAVLRVNAIPILFPSDWSPDGKYLMYYRTDTKTRLDTWVLPLFGDRTPMKILGTPYNESQGQFAPDGKSFAFVSDESGQQQVYLQSFPSSTRRGQVSTGGGTQPRWRPDGRELFYLAPDGKMMSVSIRGNDTLETDAPRPMFNTPLDSRALRQTYAVAPDGQRFLLQMPSASSSSTLTVVLNWPGLLPH
ncbi:MAG TPA: protein kinase, partial [Vicinamibacterales bacterium]|nr:protein kinase [Vicinamibacterales bacterium]